MTRCVGPVRRGACLALGLSVVARALARPSWRVPWAVRRGACLTIGPSAVARALARPSWRVSRHWPVRRGACLGPSVVAHVLARSFNDRRVEFLFELIEMLWMFVNHTCYTCGQPVCRTGRCSTAAMACLAVIVHN